MRVFRKILLTLLAVILPLLCVACAQEAQPYSLPPTREQVESLLAKYDLSWYVEEERSLYEGQIGYSLRDEEDAVCGLTAIDANGERGVNINLCLPRGYDIEQFAQQEWPRWQQLVAELYSGGDEMTTRLQEFGGEQRIYGAQIMSTSLCRRVALSNVLFSMTQASQNDLPELFERGSIKIGPGGTEYPDFDYIGTYMQNAYAPYFTERAYERFVGHAWPGLWMHAQLPIILRSLELETSVDVNDIERKQFSANVRYGADEATICGYAQFTEENLLMDFAVTGDGGLRELLE